MSDDEQDADVPQPIRTTFLRIDFVVREVSPDGSVPPDDLRYVRFGEDVSASGIRDYFERISLALTTLFQATGSQVLAFRSIGSNKIQVIKTIREVTGLGLKDSKDMVEGPLNTGVMVAHSAVHAEEAARRLVGAGATVGFFAYKPRDASLPVIAIPT